MSQEEGAGGTPARTRSRLGSFWRRHRTLFWTLHSGWALATGILVIWLARERYGFVPWVVLFLVLTWGSTLYFGRSAFRSPRAASGRTCTEPEIPGVVEEGASYVTRTMYQETLFFLLPFYAYSTVLDSPNVVFVGVLATLAMLSCIDLLFHRWLRSSRVVRLLFFAIVTFAAVNLLIPILLPVDPIVGSRVATSVAVLAALPLALQGGRPSRKGGVLMGAATAAFLLGTLAFPQLVPPVPLRMQSATFASGIQRETLTLTDTLEGRAAAAALPDGIFVAIQVFAPSVVPTEVNLRWERDGQILREGRSIEIIAHELGFGVWDAWRPQGAALVPGRYRVVMVTRAGRVFGSAELLVDR